MWEDGRAGQEPNRACQTLGQEEAGSLRQVQRDDLSNHAATVWNPAARAQVWAKNVNR